MKHRRLAATLLVIPALALAQVPEKKAAKPAATKPIATVNGVAVPQARADLLMQQQMSRGGAESS